MEERRLTIEVVVDQQSEDWHWIYDCMLKRQFLNGVRVASLSNEWTSRRVEELLMKTSNYLVENKLGSKDE